MCWEVLVKRHSHQFRRAGGFYIQFCSNSMAIVLLRTEQRQYAFANSRCFQTRAKFVEPTIGIEIWSSSSILNPVSKSSQQPRNSPLSVFLSLSCQRRAELVVLYLVFRFITPATAMMSHPTQHIYVYAHFNTREKIRLCWSITVLAEDHRW